MKEFDLSEKIKTKHEFNYAHQGFHSDPELLEVTDVKEFIRLLKEKGKCKNPSQNGEIIYLLSEKEIDKLAGEKLR